MPDYRPYSTADLYVELHWLHGQLHNTYWSTIAEGPELLMVFQADKEAVETELSRRRRLDAIPRGAVGNLTDLNQLRSRYTIGEVLSKLTGCRELVGRRRYITRCPLHDDSSASFSVNETKGLWHCFGACMKGGDIFRLVMEYNKCDFRESIKWLKGE